MGQHWQTGEPGVPSIRAIVFDTDECTGAKSVMDIYEIYMDVPHISATVLCRMLECHDGWLFDGRQVSRVDMGRATSKKGMLTKLIEQLFWKEEVS
jgi:hypothetical protein